MFARVARFEGIDPSRVDETTAQIRERLEGEPPEGLEGVRSVLTLVSRENASVLGITIFEDEESLRRGDEALNAMSPGEGGGERTAVEFYEVAIRHDR